MKRVFAIAMLMGSFHSHATDATQCVDLVHGGQGRNASLRNTCNQRIVIKYCVQNPRSMSNCARQSSAGKTLNPGMQEQIPEYVAQGGGAVVWAACFYPSIPSQFQFNRSGGHACR